MQRLRQKLAHFRETHPPRRIYCGGAEWQYFAGGAGRECILFLHGGAGTGEMFFEYFPELEDTYLVLAPSFPPEATTVARAVEGLTAILDAESVAACHVFGHSQGGMLAIELGDRLPQRVKTLMLSSTCLPSEEHARKVEPQLRILRWIPDRLLGWTMKLALKRAFRQAGSSISPEQTEVILDLMPLHDGAALRRISLSSAKLQLDYHRHPLADTPWKGPVMILETGRDRIITEKDAAALRSRYPNAVVHHPEDAGHLDVMTDPLRFVREIRAFLSSSS